MLVSDLTEHELIELSNVISVPLAQQLQTTTGVTEAPDLALVDVRALCRRPSS
jgi:hypothetical protein